MTREDEVKKLNNMPVHLGSFVLSNSKRIKTKLFHAINGFYTNDVYYGDTNNMYIENKHWDKLDEVGLVGKNLLQGKMIIKMEEYSSDCIQHPK